MIQYFNSYLVYPFLEKRQNRDIRSKVSELKQFDALSQEQQKEQIKQKLYAICKEASLHVPYYRELFQQIGFTPESILEDVRNIESIPYLTKEIIREQGARLLSEKYPSHTLHERKTGGSTGISTLIYYSQEALDWTAASNLHAISWTGKKRHMKEVHFSSLFPETFLFCDRVKEAIKCMALNRTNITTHAFNDSDLALIIKHLKRVKPYYVEGHPSTMYAVAQYLSTLPPLKKPLFSVFESTGEVLDDKKREMIEKYIGCRVYDRYGNAEFGVVAHEQDGSNHKLRVMESMVHPEIFNPYAGNQDDVLGLDEKGILSARLTPKLEQIWKSRPDLQKAYPYGLTAQSSEMWGWWCNWGHKEYFTVHILPLQLIDERIDIVERIKVLKELIWNTRSDLQTAFPNPISDASFTFWWKEHGVREYYDLSKIPENNELVLTTLTNDVMPLIRYRTGDMIENLEITERGTYIGGIIGRLHDLVTIGDKTYPTHYLQDVLDRIGNIVEFQVYNKTADTIVLHLVVSHTPAQEAIVSRLKSWWGDHVEVKFIDLNELEKVGWREKFRYLIQAPKEDENV